MHNSYIRVGHIWTIGTPVLDTEYAAFDIAQFQSVNGDLGGTWSPAAALYILGSGMGFNLPPATDVTAPWPMFANDPGGKRTKVVSYPITVPTIQAGWAMPTIAYWLIGAGATNLQQINLHHLVHGATFVSLEMYLRVPGPHVGVPAVMPNVQVSRRALVSGAPDSLVSLAPSAAFFPTPGSAAAWDAGFNVQKWTYTATQNNVIDTSQYIYYLMLQDENGANALGSNEYLGYKITYSVPSLGIGVG